MKLHNSKILITGGAGFIGSNLVDYFLENNEVIVLDNLSTGKLANIEPHLDKPNFLFIQGDIRDYETCLDATKVDIVFHQAALGSVPRSINDPITTNSVNIDGFLNVLNAVKENKVKRFIYAASSSTYGDSQALPKVEENIGKPLSPYAVTKLVNELYADVFSKLYGTETIGLRYFNVYGPKQDPEGSYAAAIPKFIKLLMNHESPIINGDGSQSRDFTHISNVILANELAATSTNPLAFGQVYNVACGSSTKLLDLVKTLKAELSKFDKEINQVEIKFGPDRIGDVKHSLASIEKINSLLGYNPIITFERGIKEAISWYWRNLGN